MQKQTNIRLTIIVPAYNEELIIRDCLEKIAGFLKKKEYGWEIVVVDDGSTDGTSEIVKGIGYENLELLKLNSNQGKGKAIRKGVEAAHGEFIIFTDADLSVPIEYVDKFMPELERGTQVVIGSRRVSGSNIIEHQGFMRESLGRGYTILSKLVTGTTVSDFTCGFKGFESSAAKKIFSKSVINRWVFDSEAIFLAKKFKFKIAEIPVVWINRKDSRITSLGGASVNSLIELLKIRLNDLTGKYA